jgi:hypothetical protein
VRIYDDTFFWFVFGYGNDSNMIRTHWFFIFVWMLSGEVLLLLHQARPSTNFITPLTIRHLAVPTDRKFAVDVQQAAVLLCAQGSASRVQTFDQMVPADDWLRALGCVCTVGRTVVASGRRGSVLDCAAFLFGFAACELHCREFGGDIGSFGGDGGELLVGCVGFAEAEVGEVLVFGLALVVSVIVVIVVCVVGGILTRAKEVVDGFEMSVVDYGL